MATIIEPGNHKQDTTTMQIQLLCIHHNHFSGPDWEAKPAAKTSQPLKLETRLPVSETPVGLVQK